MNKLKRKTAAVLCVTLLALPLCACGQDSGADNREIQNGGEGNSITNIINEAQIPVIENSIEKPDTTNASTVKFSEGSALISGNGAEEKDGVVTITKGGSYIVSGKTDNGRIIVNAPKEEVNIILENAEISCNYGSPIYVYKSSATMIYLEDGTANLLTDGSSYTFNDSLSSAADEEPNACLYSKSDLIIAGSGSLTVNGNYKNGITGKDTLRIENASINVTAAANGINGKDACVIKNANISVTSGDDGLRSTNDTDESLGYIIAVDSTLEITAGEDGIQAETYVAINGGNYTIKSGEGGSSTASVVSGTGSGWDKNNKSIGSQTDSDISAKGIKAGKAITINDGTFVLDCQDDAIHSNGDVEIAGGSCIISTGDDGIHADSNVKISAGTINITKSYEGIEGEIIDITGGTIEIVSSDDGLNAAGGADQSGFGGMRKDGFGTTPNDTFNTSSDCGINISGGVIKVNASGDGIDSNGSLSISGGEIYVSGPTDNGNAALDYDGSGTITGGLIVAAGSGSMAQNFGSSSTQGSILLTYSAYSDSEITLTDSEGGVLAKYTPEKSYNCVLVSCPALIQGGTYTVNAGGKTDTITLDTLIYGNSFGMGGFGGMGGNGGNGGMGGRPGGNDNGRGEFKQPKEPDGAFGLPDSGNNS